MTKSCTKKLESITKLTATIANFIFHKKSHPQNLFFAKETHSKKSKEELSPNNSQELELKSGQI